MDHRAITTQSELENILVGKSAKPKALPLSLLEHITNGFSDENKIGCGAFASVYKGMLDNGTMVAVKHLNPVNIDEKRFTDEVRSLMKARHRNIIQFLGYCYETRGEMIDSDGEFLFREVRQRLICTEYLPIGSLYNQITDASCGLEWSKRYKIITGICDGLYYLHQNRILHLDLKPANILLDDNMMPKIADFGISRWFGEGQTQSIASKPCGTPEYMAPELFGRMEITFKLDIYSLGVTITEMLTGKKGYYDIDKVLQMWSNILDNSKLSTQLVQVRACTEIALECTNFNPAKRLDTQQIIDRLRGKKYMDDLATETATSSSLSVMQKTFGSKGLGSKLSLELQMDHRAMTARSDVELMIFDESVEPKPLMTSFHKHNTSGFSDEKHNRHGGFANAYEETYGSKGLALDEALKLQLYHRAITAQSELEHILLDESAEPKPLPLSLLEHITCDFSIDNRIKHGGFAMVYKGMLKNGTIAVKKFFITIDTDDKKFSEEICCLMKAKHKNIVRFLGYCSDTQGKIFKCDGKLVLADVCERLLCFEYLSNGSLEKKITDASHGLEWRNRYQIIYGICDGLYYLHGLHIVHLDLKPENILLDDNLMPKIIDFGLSRCFDEKKVHAIASKLSGTIGYMAPELIHGSRLITFEADIYSLGIIMIGIITGEKEYPYPNIDNVLESWRKRLESEKSEVDTQLVQVRICTEIAIECIGINPKKRPDIQNILDRLGAVKIVDESA